MSADPQRFAQRVLQAFSDAGNHTDSQVTRADGPSTSTMTKLRKVAEGADTMPEPREPTWTKIDNAAGWSAGSARAVWAGGEPTVGASTQDLPGYVRGPGEKVEGGASDDAVLRAIQQMQRDVQEMERRLSERLEKLEKPGP